jgi:hypothetical protein
MEMMKRFAWLLPAGLIWSAVLADDASPATSDVRQVPLVFTGGYETDPRDRGRPVILVASALGVTADVFRAAFSKVHPAGPGRHPTDEEARANKQVLMAALGPYGVTDDRLNEVSNYYRYRRESGELWRHTPAAAYATIDHGKVTGITITDPGSGYSSSPVITIPGMDGVQLTAQLHFDTDLQKNGSIGKIVVVVPQ